MFGELKAPDASNSIANWTNSGAGRRAQVIGDILQAVRLEDAGYCTANAMLIVLLMFPSTPWTLKV